MQRGRFITLEGGEGTGKSTQSRLLAEALRGEGRDVITTREPGGAPGAEDIRALLVSGEPARWAPLTEVLLHTAARAEHLAKTVMPALDLGHWVVCDRFVDSTVAYQGYGHGVDMQVIKNLHREAFGDFTPDLTLVFDLPVDVGLARADTDGGDGQAEDRYERMGVDFHERLRQGFLAIAREEPDRCVVIDASSDIETVTRAAQQAVRDRLGGNT